MHLSIAFSIEYNMICHKAQMSKLAPEFKTKINKSWRRTKISSLCGRFGAWELLNGHDNN